MIGTRLFIVMLTINLLIVVGNTMGACDYSFTGELVEWTQDTLGWNLSGENTTLSSTGEVVNGTSSEASAFSNPLMLPLKGLGMLLDMFFAPLTIFMATGMPWQIQLLVGVPWSALWYVSVFSFIRGFAF